MTAFKMARNPLLRPIMRYVTPRSFVEKNVRQAYAVQNKVTESVIDRYYDLMLRAGNRETFIITCNQPREDLSQHIKALTVPTLVLWGSADGIIPLGTAERFHTDIAGSSIKLYEGAGHILQEEAPEKSAADVRVFLKS